MEDWVWVLSYVPFGCPAHDTYVVGVFRTEAAAMAKAERMNKEDGYSFDELCIESFDVVEG